MLWSYQLLPPEALAPLPPETPSEHLHPEMRPAPLNPSSVLIDVRSYAEYMAGHVEGARCLPLPRLADDIVHLVPDPLQPVLLYCATGARAEQALGLLHRLGYLAVVNGGGAHELSERMGRPIKHGM